MNCSIESTLSYCAEDVKDRQRAIPEFQAQMAPNDQHPQLLNVFACKFI